MTGGIASITPPVHTGPQPNVQLATTPAHGDDGGVPVLTVPDAEVPGAVDPSAEEPGPVDGTPGDEDPAPTEPGPEPEPVPEPTPPTPVPDPAPSTPPVTEEPQPVEPNTPSVPAPAPAPAQGPSITPESHDAASAANSARPVPRGTPTLAQTPVEGAEDLSTQQILDRSNAGIQAAASAGAGGATTDTGSGAAIAEQLRGNLQTDAQGRTIFDRKIESLEVERQRILRQLQEGGNSTDLINELLSITAQQELLHREKEKNTELLRLVVSLMMGNVPTALVGRLCALGLREVVSRIIADSVGNGRSLSREAIRSLQALASFGVTVCVAPEHQTEAAYREQDQEQRRRAATAIDGGQAAALWVRARRTGHEDDAPTPTAPRPTWAPHAAPGIAGAPAFVRWNAASTGESSDEPA